MELQVSGESAESVQHSGENDKKAKLENQNQQHLDPWSQAITNFNMMKIPKKKPKVF